MTVPFEAARHMLRVFISYATQDGPMRLIEAIEQRLEPDCSMWRDKTSIQAGDEWRNKIDFALLDCHAAVVFVTPGALESAWVLKEFAVLDFLRATARRAEAPLILLVSCDGVEPQPLLDRFRALRLDNLQSIRFDGDIDACIQRVIQPLMAFRERGFPETPIDLLAAELAQHLELVRPDRREAASKELIGHDLDRPTPDPLRLARALLGGGYRRVSRALREIRTSGSAIPDHNWRHIVELTLPFCSTAHGPAQLVAEKNDLVIQDALSKLSEYEQQPGQLRRFVVQQLLRRAKGFTPPWPHGIVEAVSGPTLEDHLSALAASVAEAFGYSADTSPAVLKRRLRSLVTKKERLVMVLRAEDYDPEMLADLRAEWDDVQLLVLLSATAGTDLDPDLHHAVTGSPSLDPHRVPRVLALDDDLEDEVEPLWLYNDLLPDLGA